MSVFNSDIFKKILGEKMIKEAEEEISAIKEKWNQNHQKHFNDHKILAELIGDLYDKLDKIEKKIK